MGDSAIIFLRYKFAPNLYHIKECHASNNMLCEYQEQCETVICDEQIACKLYLTQYTETLALSGCQSRGSSFLTITRILLLSCSNLVSTSRSSPNFSTSCKSDRFSYLALVDVSNSLNRFAACCLTSTILNSPVPFKIF